MVSIIGCGVQARRAVADECFRLLAQSSWVTSSRRCDLSTVYLSCPRACSAGRVYAHKLFVSLSTA